MIDQKYMIFVLALSKEISIFFWIKKRKKIDWIKKRAHTNKLRMFNINRAKKKYANLWKIKKICMNKKQT